MKQDYYLVGLIKTVSKMKKETMYMNVRILCLEMNAYVLLKNIFTVETNSPQ